MPAGKFTRVYTAPTTKKLNKVAKQVKQLVSIQRAPVRATVQYPMGQSKRIKMKYCDHLQFALTAGISKTHIFRLNSTYDPDFTGIGHQPQGRDQMINYFNRYRVHNVRYRILCSNSNQTTTPLIGFYVHNGTFSPVEVVALLETSSKFVQLSSTSTQSIIGKVDLAKLNGQSKIAYKTDDMTAAQADDNPGEAMYGVVWAYSDAATSALRLTIEMIYDVEWYDPIKLSLS